VPLKNPTWVRAAVARLHSRPARPRLEVRPLEDRATPSFAVSVLSGNRVLFQGDGANDALTVSVALDGSLRHDLVQPDLASEFDMDSAAAGEQRVAAAAATRLILAGGEGDDRLVNLTAIPADLEG
jgi:hypothetical protein